MVKPTLVVMAAGMGSRYGGLKQIDPIGTSGETIVEYSIYDALKAGFSKVIFIIKEEMLEAFKESIGKRIERQVETIYVFQNIEDVPRGFNIPKGRIKPWGTGHAIMCCRGVVKEPFLVINADDFYGALAFKLIHDYLMGIKDSEDFYEYCMVGFKLENTLTDNGHVARGICHVDEFGYLKGVKERTKIKRFEHEAKYTEDDENWIKIPMGSTVSMNTWGFTPSIFDELECRFPRFLQESEGNLLKAEYFLPSIVDSLIRENKAKVKVLTSCEQWYGVTYKADKPVVKTMIMQLVNNGVYPIKLWGNENGK